MYRHIKNLVVFRGFSGDKMFIFKGQKEARSYEISNYRNMASLMKLLELS